MFGKEKKTNGKTVVVECIGAILLFMLMLQVAGRCLPSVSTLSWQAIAAKAAICIAALLIIKCDRKATLLIRMDMYGFFNTGWYILAASAIFFILQLISAYELPSTERFMMFAALSLCTAASEELVFRGLVAFRLKEEFGKKESTAIISALLFAIVHLSNLISNPALIIASTTQVVYTFSLGLMLTYSYYETENLLVPVALHFIFNTFSAFSSSAASAPAAAATDIGGTDAAILLAVMVPGILWAHLETRKWKEDGEHT